MHALARPLRVKFGGVVALLLNHQITTFLPHIILINLHNDPVLNFQIFKSTSILIHVLASPLCTREGKMTVTS